MVCSLLTATSQLTVLIGEKMQLISCDYGNNMHNATCVEQDVLS